LARGPGRFASIPPDIAADLPPESVAVVSSPSEPLGTILAATDAVRLSRACYLVIVDERFAEFSGFSLLPLALEFENIVVVRSFAPWAGLDDPELGWAVAPSRRIDAVGLCPDVPPYAMEAAVAALDDWPAAEATLRLVREERSRLFRMLRKYSFLTPLPSWGPFVAARIELVPRGAFVTALCERGIRVHAPDSEGLEQFVRVGIGTRSEMEAFRQALLAIAPQMVEFVSRLGDADAERLTLGREEGVEPERGEIDHVLEIPAPEGTPLRR
jgi:histidinol-phosphate aminotransferase